MTERGGSWEGKREWGDNRKKEKKKENISIDL